MAKNRSKVPSPLYAWRYFALHAKQRVLLFRLYIIFTSIYFAAIATLFIKESALKNFELVLIILISLFYICVTFIFCGLDRRNQELIDNSKESLCGYENRIPKNFRIFLKDEQLSYFTHQRSFHLVFSLGFIIAFIAISFSLLAYNGMIPKKIYEPCKNNQCLVLRRNDLLHLKILEVCHNHSHLTHQPNNPLNHQKNNL